MIIKITTRDITLLAHKSIKLQLRFQTHCNQPLTTTTTILNHLRLQDNLRRNPILEVQTKRE
jgi:hypothetical protein